jgi:peroxiredoxin
MYCRDFYCLQAIAARYGVLLEKAGIALRGLFIINPEGIIQQITINDLVSVTFLFMLCYFCDK